MRVESDSEIGRVPSMKPSLFLADKAIKTAHLQPPKPFPSKTEVTRFIPGESDG